MSFKQHLILNVLWVLFFQYFRYYLQAPFALEDRYSVWWLMILYMTGSFVAKYEAEIKVKQYCGVLLYFLSVATAFLFKVVVEYFSFAFVSGNILSGYTSPLMVSASAGLLIFFKDMKINDGMG